MYNWFHEAGGENTGACSVEGSAYLLWARTHFIQVSDYCLSVLVHFVFEIYLFHTETITNIYSRNRKLESLAGPAK